MTNTIARAFNMFSVIRAVASPILGTQIKSLYTSAWVKQKLFVNLQIKFVKESMKFTRVVQPDSTSDKLAKKKSRIYLIRRHG